jgi:hypothetical protein
MALNACKWWPTSKQLTCWPIKTLTCCLKLKACLRAFSRFLGYWRSIVASSCPYLMWRHRTAAAAKTLIPYPERALYIRLSLHCRCEWNAWKMLLIFRFSGDRILGPRMTASYWLLLAWTPNILHWFPCWVHTVPRVTCRIVGCKFWTQFFHTCYMARLSYY